MAEPVSRTVFPVLTASRLIPQFPDDLSIQIIAGVPLSFHPDLALVSHSWRSFLRSPLLFTLRSQLGATEHFACIKLRPRHHNGRPPLSYLYIRGRPHLLPIPPPPIPTCGSATVSLGRSLYLLGGSCLGIPSNTVQIFDPRTTHWALGPCMAAARLYASASVIHGRIYVVGGFFPLSDPWVETLDPASSVWAPVPCPPHCFQGNWTHGSDMLGGQLMAMARSGGMGLDPTATLPWGEASDALQSGLRGNDAVVNGVIYSYCLREKLRGYDPVADEWKPLVGLEGELSVPSLSVLVNLGGLLCLVRLGSWRSTSREVEIVGIQVSRTNCGGLLRGSIAWRESALLPITEDSFLGRCVTLEF